jgi:hypothetical protein
MARLLADENFDHRIVRALRPLGHEISTAPSALAEPGLSDLEVVRAATQDGRAVLTHDRLHFVRLHRSGEEHGGIVVVSPDPDTQSVAQRIHEAVTEAGELRGRLLRVNLLHT